MELPSNNSTPTKPAQATKNYRKTHSQITCIESAILLSQSFTSMVPRRPKGKDRAVFEAEPRAPHSKSSCHNVHLHRIAETNDSTTRQNHKNDPWTTGRERILRGTEPGNRFSLDSVRERNPLNHGDLESRNLLIQNEYCGSGCGGGKPVGCPAVNQTVNGCRPGLGAAGKG